MASGESLARIMGDLDKKYTNKQLDNMGWGKQSRSDGKGKLSQNGRIGGGAAFVVMSPKDPEILELVNK